MKEVRRHVTLRTGKEIILYFTESTGLWSSKKPNLHSLLDGSVDAGVKTVCVINFFHESTGHTRNKIEEMINYSLDNIPVIYDMMLTLIQNRKQK